MKDIRTVKRLMALAGCLLLIAGFVSARAYINRRSGSPFAREPFNQELWLAKAKTSDGNLRRGLMVQDLTDSVIHPGMSVDRMKELLGEPDRGDLGGTGVGYVLGAWDLDYFSTENTLSITFTKDRKIEDIQVSDN